MSSIKYLLLIVLIVYSNQQLCGDNPFYNQFIDFTQYLQNYDTSIYDQINEYQQLEPSNQGNSFCTQTASDSCCKSDFEGVLKDLAYQYYRVQSDRDFFLQKFFDKFEQGLKDCSQNQELLSYEGDDLNLQEVTDLFTTYRLFILKIIRAEVQLIRGNLCILCASSANYSDYINGQKIIVDTSDMEDYIKQVTDNLEGLEGLKSSIKKAALAYYNEVSDTGNCGTQLEIANQFADNLLICTGGDCEAHVKARVQIFLQSILHELGNIVLPDFSDSRRILQENQMLQKQKQKQNQNQNYNVKRILSLDNNYEQEEGKFKTFRSQDLDEEMQYQGVTDFTYEENNVNVLQVKLSFIAIFALILLSFTFN